MIDWDSTTIQLLFNPRMPAEEKEELLSLARQLPQLNNHFLVATSGSSGKIKWTALPKEAVLLSAQAVNRHLEASSNDVWLNPLPLFHVGGLGIEARALLSGSKVLHTFSSAAKWEAGSYLEQLSSCKATLTSLVPAQLFDLAALQQGPPSSLRAAIIGGGRVDELLYFKAVEKGWPLLLSYGMTECCSQIATSSLGGWKESGFPLLQPLEHITLDNDNEGCLKICSDALLTGYLEASEVGPCFTDPKQEGWFHTKDLVEFKEGKIASVRRVDQLIKIAGESVDLARLESILEQVKGECLFSCGLALVPMPDERAGYTIQLLYDHAGAQISQLVSCFNARVFPYERIRQVHLVPTIPRSPLGKTLRSAFQHRNTIDDSPYVS